MAKETQYFSWTNYGAEAPDEEIGLMGAIGGATKSGWDRAQALYEDAIIPRETWMYFFLILVD